MKLYLTSAFLFIESLCHVSLRQMTLTTGVKPKPSFGMVATLRGCALVFLVLCSVGAKAQDFSDTADGTQLTAINYTLTGEATAAAPAIVINKKASFNGGKRYKDVNAYVQARLKFPEEGVATGSYGTLKVDFAIEADGSIGEIKVLESPGEAFTSSVVKLLNEMPQWSPAYKDNAPVRSNHILLLKFRLQ